MNRRLLLLVARGGLVFVTAAVVTWLALPSPVGSLPFIPSPAPALDGAYRQNDLLKAATLRYPGIVGPENIAFDTNGIPHAGLEDGRIVRFEGDRVVDVANTLGRPLGLEFSPRDGSLFVADAERGLLQIQPATGEVKIIVNEAEGFPFMFTDDVEITHDGVVYFTDASAVWGYGKETEDLLDQRPSGRVLRYDPETGATQVVARELSFANGLALAPDERSLYIAETGRYRIWRLWLDGEKRNLKEPIIENLPGFPDNLTVSPRGTIWVGMASTRKRVLDLIHPYPVLKNAFASLPGWLRPKPVRWGFALEISRSGVPLRSLQDPSGEVISSVTTVLERDGQLWLSSLHGRGLHVLPAPPPAPLPRILENDDVDEVNAPDGANDGAASDRVIPDVNEDIEQGLDAKDP